MTSLLTLITCPHDIACGHSVKSLGNTSLGSGSHRVVQNGFPKADQKIQILRTECLQSVLRLPLRGVGAPASCLGPAAPQETFGDSALHLRPQRRVLHGLDHREGSCCHPRVPSRTSPNSVFAPSQSRESWWAQAWPGQVQ